MKYIAQCFTCLVKIKHCVKSVRIRSFSGPYSVQMRENTVQETPNTNTFYAMSLISKAFQKQS